MSDFTHSHNERTPSQVEYVAKYGVLGFGLSMALGTFLLESYQHDTWGSPREFVWRLVFWMVWGIPFGLSRFRDEERRARHDGLDRCGECGEVLPVHTHWCSHSVLSHRGAD